MYNITNNNPESLDIEWTIFNTCNYKCSYCNPTLNGGTSEQIDKAPVLNFFKKIDEQYSSIKLLTLSGGEPTLWPHLAEFFAELPSSYYTALITNGSRTIRWWGDFFKKYDKIFRITISVHFEFADLDHIRNLCKFLQDKTEVSVLLLVDDKNFAVVKKFAETLTTENLSIAIKIKPIITPNANYSDELISFIKEFKYKKSNRKQINIPRVLIIDGVEHNSEYANTLIADAKHHFKGWHCDLGKTRLFIWYDGNVYPASCNTAKKYKIGNIFDNNIKLPNGAICEDAYCSCSPNIRIPKHRV